MIDADVILGARVNIFNPQQVNIFGCEVGDDTFIGPFVEITRGVKIGARCKIESHSFLCTGVTINDDVFIGHGVIFTNDSYPRTDRQVVHPTTRVDQFASLGSHATILGGITIGAHAVIGAGSVVTKDVPSLAIVAGNPARIVRQFATLKDFKSYIAERQAER
jgi:UDP-2-acetamido-3-amino-2,3-dideoxy-glucuronate N-acetyltransferase